jgi:hypothetical protein
MTHSPDPLAGIVRVGPFAGLYHRFEELIASSSRMILYFIHSRRWRENHDAAIKGFVGRPGTSLEVFLPDLESRELMFSLGRHFEDGAQIPALVVDAYRYFARLARDSDRPLKIRLFGRYPAYSFYVFDDHAVGRFLARDVEDLRKECRRCAPADLESVIARAAAIDALSPPP